MPVMAVGRVPVPVAQVEVPVAVAVRLRRRIIRSVIVAVMLVVRMPVVMLDRRMVMLVFVALGEMEPKAEHH